MSGGEDTVVASEKKMLEENGHTVITYYRNNSEIDDFSTIKKLGLLTSTTRNEDSYEELYALMQTEKPDVCHVHNFLPLVSPAVSAACKSASVPLVQTLHNFRLICTNALLYRDKMVCEECLGNSPYHAVSKKCYRDSYLQTFAVARMLEKTNWSEYADAYLCFTEFMKEKFIAHGLPKNKLHVKPNFVTSSENKESSKHNSYLIYVGRLDENKGVRIFKEIAHHLPAPLKIIGEGDLQHELANTSNIELLGKKSSRETRALIHGAKALLFTSKSYEGMPMTILEAFAEKTLVIASNLGAMQSMIQPKQNGLLFEKGNATELLQQINFALSHPNHVSEMINQAFSESDTYYSKNNTYQMLMSIYNQVIK